LSAADTKGSQTHNGNTTGGIRLLLETDAIVPPLTGIGRYTLELTKAFRDSREVEDLRCFSRGQWYSAEKIIAEQHALEASAPSRKIDSRPRWTENPIKIVAKKLLPKFQQHALRKYSKTHIYHAPNYRLLPYSGRKVATFHDLSLLKYPEFHPDDRRRVLIPAIEKAAVTADHLITDSQQVRREVIEHFGLPEDKVTAIHLASSLEPGSITVDVRDAYLREAGLAPGNYLLFVSTLEPRKNIEILLAAFERLPNSVRKRYPLVLVGQLGWKSEGIKTALEKALRRGDVIHTGFLSNQQLSCLYSGARAFVYPSLYEGFGLPLVEAQAFGIPLITSNCSCMPEIVGSSALLIDPQDDAALGAAMQSIVDDDALHDKLVQEGKNNSARFSWKKTAREVIQVYRSLSES
jgi:glycosyltransferase involved in cell wall biosynthesis